MFTNLELGKTGVDSSIDWITAYEQFPLLAGWKVSM
jgi:hypothetical protein